MLYLRSGNGADRQWSTGEAGVVAAHEEGPHRYLIGVRCRLGTHHSHFEQLALLDTGAEWSLVDGESANQIHDALSEPMSEITLSTRLGTITGHLRRTQLTIPAESGVDLSVEATVLVADDWFGPVVLGFRGFLERIRIALDPGTDADAVPRLYFGELS